MRMHSLSVTLHVACEPAGNHGASPCFVASGIAPALHVSAAGLMEVMIRIDSV